MGLFEIIADDLDGDKMMIELFLMFLGCLLIPLVLVIRVRWKLKVSIENQVKE